MFVIPFILIVQLIYLDVNCVKSKVCKLEIRCLRKIIIRETTVHWVFLCVRRYDVVGSVVLKIRNCCNAINRQSNKIWITYYILCRKWYKYENMEKSNM